MIRNHLLTIPRAAGIVLSAALSIACSSSTPPPTDPTSAAPVFSATDLPPGTHVQVSRAGQWYPATIVQAVGVDRFMVSYDGYPPQYNEAVSSDRIKAPGAGGATGAAGAASDYRVGEKVLVTSQNRLLLADVVQQVGQDKWRVHFDGYGPEVADNVGPDRLRRPFTGTSSHAAGEQVSVEVNGQVLPAKIIAVSTPDRWIVRYVGYGPEYDQEIGADRLRAAAAPPAVVGVAPPPPPAIPPGPPDKGGKKAPPLAAAPPPVPAAPPPLQVGDAVAVSQRGVFFPATISAAAGAGKWKVRFEGSTGDEEVASDRVVRASAPPKGEKLQPNQLVLIEWHGVYVPGKILKEQDKGQYKIRFDGKGPENDEIVAIKRLRLR